MSEFWAMGDYGIYVWTSFGLTLVVLLYLVVKPWFLHRRLKQQLIQAYLEEQSRESR